MHAAVSPAHRAFRSRGGRQWPMRMISRLICLNAGLRLDLGDELGSSSASITGSPRVAAVLPDPLIWLSTPWL